MTPLETQTLTRVRRGHDLAPIIATAHTAVTNHRYGGETHEAVEALVDMVGDYIDVWNDLSPESLARAEANLSELISKLEAQGLQTYAAIYAKPLPTAQPSEMPIALVFFDEQDAEEIETRLDEYITDLSA